MSVIDDIAREIEASKQRNVRIHAFYGHPNPGRCNNRRAFAEETIRYCGRQPNHAGKHVAGLVSWD